MPIFSFIASLQKVCADFKRGQKHESGSNVGQDCFKHLFVSPEANTALFSEGCIFESYSATNRQKIITLVSKSSRGQIIFLIFRMVFSAPVLSLFIMAPFLNLRFGANQQSIN